MPNRTREMIEKEIEDVDQQIFILEMKDHMTNDDFELVSKLNSQKDELISQLKGMN